MTEPEIDVEALLRSTILFEQLTQPMRCWAIVGCYIGHFALIEEAISNALSALLDLDSLAGAIVARNMGMVEKVQAVRTLVNIAAPASEKGRLNDLLKLAKSAAEDRNVVAHVAFGASDTSDGVQFHSIQAKGTFRAVRLDWSISTCNEKIEELRAIEIGLNSQQSRSALDDARHAIKGSSRPVEEWWRVLGRDTPRAD